LRFGNSHCQAEARARAARCAAEPSDSRSRPNEGLGPEEGTIATCLAHSDDARAGVHAVRACADNHPSAAIRDGHQECNGQIILGVLPPCCLPPAPLSAVCYVRRLAIAMANIQH
jgi:hypothetical protein